MLMKLWKLMIREAKHLLCEGRSHRKEMLRRNLPTMPRSKTGEAEDRLQHGYNLQGSIEKAQ